MIVLYYTQLMMRIQYFLPLTQINISSLWMSQHLPLQIVEALTLQCGKKKVIMRLNSSCYMLTEGKDNIICPFFYGNTVYRWTFLTRIPQNFLSSSR